jgi:hypothetical protein
MRRVVLALVAVATAQHSVIAQQPASTCQTTATVHATSPLERSADPVGGEWYINEDKSIWVSVPRDGWNAGGQVYRGDREVKGQKTYWVRPRGTALAVSAVRLDGLAPTVEADVPCCYTSGFQIVALHFPTEGCWEVRATSGDHFLSFVTKVLPPLPPRPPLRGQ